MVATHTSTVGHRDTAVANRGRLARDLIGVVRGEVRFDQPSRHLYANDASIYRAMPIGVVIPRDEDDVVAAVRVCREHRVPILARGGGTGLAGQTVNTAVVFDFSKYMNDIIELDPEGRTAVVQPGVICDQLRYAAMEYGLTFAPDPATHDHNTLGGMIGNNSCGTHSVYGGKTVDNVLELDVLLYDGTRMTLGVGEESRLDELAAQPGRPGEIYTGLRAIRDRYGAVVRERFPDIPRRVSGYNLDDLLPEKGFNSARALVGTECTCLLVLSARVRLLPWPPKRSLVVLGYPDTPTAAEHVTEILDTSPHGLEFFESGIIDNLKTKGFTSAGMDELPRGKTFVLVEYGGDSDEEARRQGHAVIERLQDLEHAPDVKEYDDPQREADIWEVRRGAIGSTKIPQQHPGYAGWEDAAVHPSRLGPYLRDFQALVDRYGYRTVLFGHFGQGCTHCRLDMDFTTAAGVDTFHRFLRDAGDLVIAYGGVPSGEHGDGQLRAELLPQVFGPELMTAFEEFKDLFDPDGMMNPGKVVRARSPVDDLRITPDSNPPALATHFHFLEDGGNFADAADRCFGVGACRHLDGGTMCPSFMVTREEKNSTRGRARMLFEMMQTAGERKDPWRDEGVKDALDLCLACKGCKSDCPTRVDMATYKAEFLSHYFAHRLRPRSAYALGLIQQWARLASLLPVVANRLESTPATAWLLKAVAGVAPERGLPRFADHTFRDWDRTRSPDNPHGRNVIVWADTFTDHFEPHVGMSAVQVLEDAGFHVHVPTATLCCGRPLYDYGMLHTAERYLRRILDMLRPQIRGGVPIVVLEPSCAAVFHDELRNLMPHDEDARRLSAQTYTFAGFLARYAPDWRPRRRSGKALVQVHCHQQAEFGFDDERTLLERTGLDVDIPDSGCCGMAGSFGYEQGERHEVSVACAERILLPKVREAADDTIIVADGFSCREQIDQLTDRAAVHLAELLAVGLRQPGPLGDRPEQRIRAVVPKPFGPSPPRRTFARGDTRRHRRHRQREHRP